MARDVSANMLAPYDASDSCYVSLQASPAEMIVSCTASQKFLI
jgi:hypothetical protein